MIITSTAEITQIVIKKGWIEMLNLPGKDILDSQIIQMLQGNCKKIIEVPTEHEGMVAFQSESLQVNNNATLILGIEQERTHAGRGMVRGLWRNKPVIVWLYNRTQKLRLVTFPYRCLIVGPVFSKIYNEVKSTNPEAEVSVVWELVVKECQVADARPPKPIPQKQEGEFEYHLDHISLKQGREMY